MVITRCTYGCAAITDPLPSASVPQRVQQGRHSLNNYEEGAEDQDLPCRCLNGEAKQTLTTAVEQLKVEGQVPLTPSTVKHFEHIPSPLRSPSQAIDKEAQWHRWAAAALKIQAQLMQQVVSAQAQGAATTVLASPKAPCSPITPAFIHRQPRLIDPVFSPSISKDMYVSDVETFCDGGVEEEFEEYQGSELRRRGGDDTDTCLTEEAGQAPPPSAKAAEVKQKKRSRFYAWLKRRKDTAEAKVKAAKAHAGRAKARWQPTSSTLNEVAATAQKVVSHLTQSLSEEQQRRRCVEEEMQNVKKELANLQKKQQQETQQWVESVRGIVAALDAQRQSTAAATKETAKSTVTPAREATVHVERAAPRTVHFAAAEAGSSSRGSEPHRQPFTSIPVSKVQRNGRKTPSSRRPVKSDLQKFLALESIEELEPTSPVKTLFQDVAGVVEEEKAWGRPRAAAVVEVETTCYACSDRLSAFTHTKVSAGRSHRCTRRDYSTMVLLHPAYFAVSLIFTISAVGSASITFAALVCM